ncbi:hypothetical protein L596_014905 [Steinernema carpocapsae]|uniref:C2H2-type domain-containing protein n=1 Tax=Steinernema carpocapsae TaxID=34508 RepID=A0A4V6A331_STECR|nr:hypothetical protein L596_014905 [Steinernema carpocapsae]
MVCRDSLPVLDLHAPASTSPPPSPNTALALLIASATSNPEGAESPSSESTTSSMDPAAAVQAIVSSLAGSAPPETASSSTAQSSSSNGTNPSGAGSSSSAPHQCSMCSKSFATSKLLQNHQHMFHTEKAFICEICGKAFRFRSNLAEHRSVHTALKPYVCKFCGKSSRLKGNLTKHILKHHKLEQNAYIGKDDIIIKKGKKSVKDPAAVDFLQKSMIVLTGSGNSGNGGGSTVSSSAMATPNRENIDDDADASRSFFMSLGLDAGSMDLSGNSPDGSEHGGEQLLDASTDRHEISNDFDSDTSNASPSVPATVSAPLIGNGSFADSSPVRPRSENAMRRVRKTLPKREPAPDAHVGDARISSAGRLSDLLGRRPTREELRVWLLGAERRLRARAARAPADQVHDRRAPLGAEHGPRGTAAHWPGLARRPPRKTTRDGVEQHLHARAASNRNQLVGDQIPRRRFRPTSLDRAPSFGILRLSHSL